MTSISSLAKTSVVRNGGILTFVLLTLIGGTWEVVRMTTNHLLYIGATSRAYEWAHYLAANVTDLQQIGAGEQPSTASMVFFQAVRSAGPVFRYEIFNREGYSQLISDHDKVAFVDVSEYNAEAARSATTGAPIVDTRETKSAEASSFFALAYVPVVVDRQAIAVVAAFVDQTQQRNVFYNTFFMAAAALCLLMGLSFGVPAIALARRHQADRHLRFLAHYDALTRLTNRAHLMETFDGMLAKLPLRGDSLAVHFIDLDHFKEINDTFGHDAGDFMLTTSADRLGAMVRSHDVVARLGGDEFVVLQSGVASNNQIEAFARRINLALSAPIPFKKHEIQTTASIGVAVAPADGKDSERLLKCADLALYKSKAAGGDCVRFFLPEMDG